MERHHKEASEQLGEDKERFKQIEAALASDVPSIHILGVGGVPVVKSRPQRTLIVVAAVFLAFLFSIIGILIIDTYKDVDWKKIVNPS